MGKPAAPVTLAALTALAFMVAGCGGGDDAGGSDQASGTTALAEDESAAETTAAPTTTARLSPEEEVLRDLDAATAAFAAAANPPNPDHPELLARYTGSALEGAQGYLRGLQESNAGAEISVEHNAVGVSIAGMTATLTDCFVDRTQLISLETHEPVSEQGITTVHVDVRLERGAGPWMIARQMQRSDACTPG